jgi:hypothetical protein
MRVVSLLSEPIDRWADLYQRYHQGGCLPVDYWEWSWTPWGVQVQAHYPPRVTMHAVDSRTYALCQKWVSYLSDLLGSSAHLHHASARSSFTVTRSDVLCKICYRLGIHTILRSSSVISMGSYVTCIGHKLGLNFNEDDMSRISHTIDTATHFSSQFIRISRASLPGIEREILLDLFGHAQLWATYGCTNLLFF